MTITELAHRTMARDDVYEAAGRGTFEWEEYLIGRLDEAGLPVARETVLELSRAMAATWKPEVPLWDLRSVLKPTAAQDRKTMATVEKMLIEAQTYCGARLVYEQDGHEWEVIELKAGKVSGTPQARVKRGGRWFCFASADGFSVKGGRV